MGFWSQVGHWLLPQTCAHCKEDLPAGAAEPLCDSCRKDLPAAEPPYCLRCAEPLSAGKSLCASCAGRPFACRLVRAAYLYRGPIPGLVHAFKYRGRREAARAAGRWMAARWPQLPELSGSEVLVPVPLHPRRLSLRGFNQALLLAEELSIALRLPVWDLLERCRPTDPQWDLDRQARQRNLSGAFRAKSAPHGAAVLLIDDVCTSGASLEECARALHRAGALRIAAYVLARQPLTCVGN